MSINIEQVKKYWFIPALAEINMLSDDALSLMLRTFAVESDCGSFLVQLNDGPAKNFMNIEEPTFEDIWFRYLRFKKELRNKIMLSCNILAPVIYEELTYNIKLCIQTARIKYAMNVAPLPNANDIHSQAMYWKRHYNTLSGAGKVEDFIEKAKLYKV